MAASAYGKGFYGRGLYSRGGSVDVSGDLGPTVTLAGDQLDIIGSVVLEGDLRPVVIFAATTLGGDFTHCGRSRSDCRFRGRYDLRTAVGAKAALRGRVGRPRRCAAILAGPRRP